MRIIQSLSRILNIIASFVLAAMMMLTVADVFLRYFFKSPILGTTEITESMMSCLAFFALAWCAVQHGHLKVDLVVSLFSPRVQALIDSITSLAGMVIVALIAWRSLLEGIEVQRLQLISSLVKIPAFPFYYVIALGCMMLCLVIATQFIQNIKKMVRG
jgi:TRAP-type C4-dicarboxylate transport system permease small subunit